MVILVKGKVAVLKKGTSFDYISENRFFTGADSYTLSITFPLKGCPENQEIFSWLNRKDCDTSLEKLECEIHDKQFEAYGCLSIVDINETEVKTQFLEGQSAINYSCDFDDIYINEMELLDVAMECHWGPEDYLHTYQEQLDNSPGDGINIDYVGLVCFPWVNNTTGNVQNQMKRRIAGGAVNFLYEDQDCVGQPYLMYVLERMFDECGYTFDKTVFAHTKWYNCVICNTLPKVWKMTEFAKALPHWTITEFLEQWELIMDGKFHIDTKALKVTFSFNRTSFENLPSYELKNVIDTFKVEIDTKDKSSSSSDNEYIEHRNLAFSDCDHAMWKYYSCYWLRNRIGKVIWNDITDMRNTLDKYLTHTGALTHNYYKLRHLIKNLGLEVVLRVYATSGSGDNVVHRMRYQPVNRFGPYILKDNADGDVTEIDIVPACIDYAGATNGDMLFLECGELDSDSADDNDDQTYAINVLNGGEQDKQEEFFDKVYFAFWDGQINRYGTTYLPHPIVDAYEFEADGTFSLSNYTCAIQDDANQDDKKAYYGVDQTVKYTFQFLSDTIPNVQSIFFIHGKKYLAEKITATFSEDGMSHLLKMVCYRMKTPAQART